MDFITGHVDELEHARIESHLLECAECQKIYQEFAAAEIVWKDSIPSSPGPIYFTNILPRVRERIATKRKSFLELDTNLTRLLVPLAASLFLIIVLTKVTTDYSTESGQIEALRQTVKDYNADEVIQAISTTYAHSTIVQNQDIAGSAIIEHFSGDNFFGETVIKQIESEDVTDIVIEGVISNLEGEQVDQLLSRLSERTML